MAYVPIGRGFLCLVAVIDGASRAVLAWRRSNTMEVSVCVSALEEALARFCRPEIFNTDQGSQLTSAVFTSTLASLRHPDLDGWSGPLAGQRLHRTAAARLEHEDICLKGDADGREAKTGIAERIAFYNHRRPHQALANRTPMAVWRDPVTGASSAAAVDMTLRLDNAGGLPTCPQPHQPQVPAA